MADVFDQVAPAPQKAPPAPANGVNGGGDVFDQVAGGPGAQAAPNQQQGGFLEQNADTLKQIGNAPTDMLVTGPVKALGRTAIGADNLVRKALNAMGGNYQQIQTPKALESSNTAQSIGGGLENVLEFIAGDEALQGLKVGDRLTHISQVAKVLEAHPTIAKLAGIGLSAMRQGVVGGAQAGVHGASPGQAVETGATTAGIGAGLGAASEMVGKIAPGVKQIAGENIPVRASESSPVAGKAEYLAESGGLKKFDVEQTQPAARRAIGNIATEVRNKAVEGLPGEAEKVGNFGEAATSVKKQAQPVFDKLDELSDGEFSKLQRQERSARAQKDFDKVDEIQNQQDALFEKYKGDIGGDLDKAQAAWKKMRAMEKVHKAFQTAVHPTPEELLRPGEKDPGYINGKILRNKILKLNETGMLQKAGLSPQHVQSLQELGAALENGNNVRKLSSLMKFSLAGAGIGTAIIHPASAATVAATAGGELAGEKFMAKIMTDPKFASALVKGLRSGASVGTVSQSLRALLTSKEQSQSQEQQ